MKMRFSISIVVLVCVILCSCTQKRAEKLGKENFSKIYARLLIISETVPVTTDSLVRIKRQKIDSLFSAWSCSEENFRENVRLYHETPGEWPEILKMVGREIDSLRIRGNLNR